MVYMDDGRYVTVNEARTLHPGLWDRKTKKFYRVSSQRVAAKRLCLRVYSAYSRVKWVKTWTEDDSRLDKQIQEILVVLHTQAKTLKPELDAADRRAEEEHRDWEAKWLILSAERERSLIEKDRKLSLQDLLKTIDKWSEGQRIQAFFEDVAKRAASLPDDQRADVMTKIEEAQTLLSEPDSLTLFAPWRMPSPPAAE